ncbi:hypothetical protein [Aestuariimicrobium kwangyangense]|uniref:aldose epimerase family protein n=1 Tax=Aestuariimicrobium kwangyangense TaxID=396389 RepID=UPI0003B3DBD5|nr:hypothetical protein [Aestuariimicrobium kwangyangense]
MGAELTALEGVGADDGSWWVADHGSHAMAWQSAASDHPVLWHAPESLWESALDDQDGAYLRGGVPICFPWFGTGGTPAHGLARRQVWERLDEDWSDDGATLRVRHWLIHDQLEAFHTVTMAPDSLELVLEFTNNSPDEQRVEAAHHTYLAVSDVTRVSIDGLAGAPYWDAARDRRDVIPPGPVSIHPRTDAVIDTTGVVRLGDPGWGRSITVEREGSPQVVVWNSRPAVDPGLGVTNDHWREFVCIESALCREHALPLAPGATHRLVTRLTVTPTQ